MRNYAMLGKWHVHAPQYGRELNAIEGCRVARVWDPDEAVAGAWAEELGAAASTLEEILGDPQIEGVVIGTSTNMHDGLIERCCAAGKALFTEKVLSLTNEGAQSMRKAVLENNTRFAISLVHFSDPAIQYAIQAARSGRLGTVNYMRMRKAHNGATGGWLPDTFFDPETCGGGAMIDLGAHPMYLIPAVLGEPVRVQSSFMHVTGKAVEDNAVSLLSYENGAIGVAETGFVSVGYPLTMEIGGTEGTVITRDGEVFITVPGPDGRPKLEQVSELPERLPSPLHTWALAKSPAEIPQDIGIEAAVRLTRMMVAAYAGQ